MQAPTVNYDLPPYDFYTEGAELERRTAREIYRQTVTLLPERIEQLRRVMAAFGVVLSSSDEGLVELGRWFIDSIEPDEDGSGHAAPAWRGLTHDVSLFIGEAVIERWPEVSWGFPTGAKRAPGYQRASLVTSSGSAHSTMFTEYRARALAYEALASRGIRPVAPAVMVRGVEFDLEASQAARDWPRPPDNDLLTFVQRVGAKLSSSLSP